MTFTPPSPGEAGALPPNTDPELGVQFTEHQRRWTVLLRLILAVPQIVVLGFVSIAAAVVQVIGWFAALFTGRLPDWVAEFLTGFVAWETRLSGYLMLLTDQYPPFALVAVDYPIDAVIPSHGELHRLAVLFRIILLIPVMIVSSLVIYGWFVVGLIIWLIVLVLGRMPAPLFLATSATLRYQLRYQSYSAMLTSAYPKKLLGDGSADSEPATGTPRTRPLLLSTGAQVLVIAFIVFGVLGYIGQGVAAESGNGNPSRTTTASSGSN
jgi:hypothetical protein